MDATNHDWANFHCLFPPVQVVVGSNSPKVGSLGYPFAVPRKHLAFGLEVGYITISHAVVCSISARHMVSCLPIVAHPVIVEVTG